MHPMLSPRSYALMAATVLSAACAEDVATPNGNPPDDRLALSAWDDNLGRGGSFRFTPLASSAVCTDPRAATEKPFVLPSGFEQVAFAREGDGGTLDLWDMNTQNETGPQTGRFLYRTHEVGGNGQVSVTDLKTLREMAGVVTSETRVLAQRADWERLDGIVWTPWRTILAAEEVVNSTLKDPALPTARGGHVYEINPSTGFAVLRASIGSRSHEGLRFDPAGNLYGISEASPPTGGYIYKFVPKRRGDLSRGTLYALKIVQPTGDRTGGAVWVPLDDDASKLDSDAEATRVGATGYGRPEDVETATSTGTFNPWTLFVAITSEDRVLAIDLRPIGDDDEGDDNGGSAFVYDYVRAGVNAPADFDSRITWRSTRPGTSTYRKIRPRILWERISGLPSPVMASGQLPSAQAGLPAWPIVRPSRVASTSMSLVPSSTFTFSTGAGWWARSRHAHLCPPEKVVVLATMMMMEMMMID